MKVGLIEILNSEQELNQLCATPLPPKAKYWVMRIAEKARAAGAEFANKRNQLIMDFGQLMFLAAGVEGAQPEWKVADKDQDLTGLQTNWQVKPENGEEYVRAATELGEAWEPVDIPFAAISLDALGDTPIAFDLSKLSWMLNDGRGLRVVE